MDILKRFHKQKVFLGIFSVVVVVLFILFYDDLVNEYNNMTPIGYRYRQASGGIVSIPVVVIAYLIPNGVRYFFILLDMIFKKQKKIIITNTRKVSPDIYGDSKDYYYWYAKDKRKIHHRFVVYNDVYSLKAKKKTNTYEVTYFRFSKVVTEIKKVNSDTKAYKGVVDNNGRVVIPKLYRDAVGILLNTVVKFGLTEDGSIIISKDE